MEVELTQKTKLTNEQKWGIVIAYKYFHLKHNEIQVMFDIGSKGTITKIWKKYCDFGEVIDMYEFSKKNPKKCTEAIENKMTELIEATRDVTSMKIQKELKEIDVELSDRTIRSIRGALKFKHSKQIEIPMITENHIQKRFEYSKKYLNANFSNTLFTDESMFLLYQNKTVVWYRPGEKKQPLEKPNPIARVMVWGAFVEKTKPSCIFLIQK